VESTVDFAVRMASVYQNETEKKEKVLALLKEYTTISKEFEALLIAWTQLVYIRTDEDMALRAMLYEAEISSPWGI
jgi:hypothetical protein